MLQDAGRFEAADAEAAAEVVSAVLGPGRVEGGERWANLTLEIDPDRYEEDNVLFSVVAARGPSAPLATITAATGGKRPQAAAVGIQHRAGTKALEQLHAAGVRQPEIWRLVQDHPRRGLVLAVPADAPIVEVTTWLLEAMAVLNRAPVLTGVTYEVYATD
jgi:hypothetical protein